MALIEKELIIDELANTIHQLNVSKGFWPENKEERNKSEVLMLVVSELAEAQEALRENHFTNLSKSDMMLLADLADKDPEGFKREFEAKVKNTFEDEMIDTLIRQLDALAGFNIDILFHLFMKLKYNSLRPHKHGKNF
jgi:hypothetical protein